VYPGLPKVTCVISGTDKAFGGHFAISGFRSLSQSLAGTVFRDLHGQLNARFAVGIKKFQRYFCYFWFRRLFSVVGRCRNHCLWSQEV